jgi:hypothetical protein
MPLIRLQPKQDDLDQKLRSGRARTIGCGGGRGSAKSGGIDRVALTRLIEEPGIVACVVMRTYKSVRKYHIDSILRTWPELEEFYHISEQKLVVPVGGGKFSQLDLGYAENYDAVEQFFRSANYKYIFVDQAEQFLESELREIRKACRWPGGGAKLVLAHNMGGAGIQTLRKWFHTKEFGPNEDPLDYDFIKFNPWDNVEWVRPALEADNLTEDDYYEWTDEQRMQYASRRGEYTKELASDDDALRNRDWLGSWESLEGAYFGRVFDLASTRIRPDQAAALVKPWSTRWISQDWGKAHFCSTHWHARHVFKPSEIKEILGWDVKRPLGVVVTYRELITNERTSKEVAREIVNATPEGERELLKRYFLSPDAFGERDSENTIAILQGKELAAYGMPRPIEADNDRKGGWGLMAELLREAKAHGASAEDRDVWLISSECPEALNTIPLLMRDPKDLDDVLKTDKGHARLEQDVADDLRYGLKSMLRANLQKPVAVQAQEIWEDLTNKGVEHHSKAMAMIAFQDKSKQKKGRKSSWRRY